jgi:hypothetical protein
MTKLDEIILDLLKQAGLPDSCISIDILMLQNQPTVICCVFYPKVNNKFVIKDDSFVTEYKAFKLVEVE